MLILSRQAGQTICIGHDVRITVLSIRPEAIRKPRNVQLAIEAPGEIRVDEEVQPKGGASVVVRLGQDFTIEAEAQIHITVIDTQTGKVRLGIDAPRSLPVHREEVYEAIKREGNPHLGEALEALTHKGAREVEANRSPPRLQLARAVGEGVVVGEDITILVLNIIGDEVRLSIRTPDPAKVDIAEHRREVVGKTVKAMLTAGAGHSIAPNVFLSVQAVESSKVQLVIEAPEGQPIFRKETWDRLH